MKKIVLKIQEGDLFRFFDSEDKEELSSAQSGRRTLWYVLRSCRACRYGWCAKMMFGMRKI